MLPLSSQSGRTHLLTETSRMPTFVRGQIGRKKLPPLQLICRPVVVVDKTRQPREHQQSIQCTYSKVAKNTNVVKSCCTLTCICGALVDMRSPLACPNTGLSKHGDHAFPHFGVQFQSNGECGLSFFCRLQEGSTWVAKCWCSYDSMCYCALRDVLACCFVL